MDPSDPRLTGDSTYGMRPAAHGPRALARHLTGRPFQVADVPVV